MTFHDETKREREVIRARFKLLELAERLGNVSLACERLGYSRDSFYRFKKLYEAGGIAALTPTDRRRPIWKNQVPAEVEMAVMKMVFAQPEWGKVRVAKALRAQNLTISPSGVRHVWLRHEADNLKIQILELRDRDSHNDAPWFTPADAARIIAVDGRLSEVSDTTLGTVAGHLTDVAKNFRSQFLDNAQSPSYVGPIKALRRLASAAQALAHRLQDGHATSRQAMATIRAFIDMPDESDMALRRAAGTETIVLGSLQYEAIRDIIRLWKGNQGLTDRQLAFAAATDLNTWATQAIEICPRKHPEHRQASALIRGFALDVIGVLQRDAGLPPVQVRRTDAQSDPGSPSGPTFRALEMAFAQLRSAWNSRGNLPFYQRVYYDVPELRPRPETLFEWIRTAQGKPRRLRGVTRRNHCS